MWYLLPANTTFAYTRADSLRGGNGSGRNWWDVIHYDLRVTLDTAKKSISGANIITLRVIDTPRDSIQIDLQEPLGIGHVSFRKSDTGVFEQIPCRKEGNVWWIIMTGTNLRKGDSVQLQISYGGIPKAATNPPWDGGMIWSKDSIGNAWISVACQGLGASVWWPCKDIQSDEPDSGMNMGISLKFVGAEYKKFTDQFKVVTNGYPDSESWIEEGEMTPVCATGYDWHWSKLKNPINTYNVALYVGNYMRWRDTIIGEKGVLTLDFYALKHNEEKARKQFAVAKEMLHCFEYWMGPYPFYEDGYKLVEAPFLGMEHQSGIAYGNEYKMGYKGKDRSGTGVGLKFDFIIIHESGHEWYGNNITASDIADNWIHEGFTTYTETLFAEWISGKEKAYEYVRGQRKNILNNIPVIGPYGVQGHGSGDMYDKGATIVHMIRVAMNDDVAFRKMLREMNQKFYHSFATSAQIEDFIVQTDIKYHKKPALNYKPFFEQYLRTTKVPELEYYIKDNRLYYRFINVVEGFSLPLTVTDGSYSFPIQPTANWQSIKWKWGFNVSFSKDFYYTVKG